MNSPLVEKERLQFADNLRGFLILLVVLGHCIQFSDTDFDHNIVFRYIYAFHMPLFMFLSGFVSYRRDYQWTSARRRISQLVVPFVCWAALDMAVNRDFDFAWLREPDRALWFLWVLFWISVLHIALSKLSRKLGVAEEIVMAVAICLFAGLFALGRTSFGLGLISWYLPYYCIGAFTRKYYRQLRLRLSFACLPLLTSYAILGWFWMREGTPTFMTGDSKVIVFAYKFITGLIGSYCFLALAQLWNHRVLYLTELGGITLGIYAVHQPIVHAIIDSGLLDAAALSHPAVQVAAIFALTLAASIGWWFILSRIPVLSKLFLGK